MNQTFEYYYIKYQIRWFTVLNYQQTNKTKNDQVHSTKTNSSASSPVLFKYRQIYVLDSRIYRV